MADIRFQEWQALYLQAVQEPLDSAEIPQRLKVAETAISMRLLTLVPTPAANVERQALALAAQSLTYVRHAIAANATKHNSKPRSRSKRFQPRDEMQD